MNIEIKNKGVSPSQVKASAFGADIRGSNPLTLIK